VTIFSAHIGAHGRALKVGVDAEAREAGDRVREVDLPARLERLLLLGREDPVQEGAKLLRRQRARVPARERGRLREPDLERERDESLLRRLALPRFGDAPLAAIGQRDVRAWVADLSARGLAPATVPEA
jgi:hypothetical protein